MGTNAIEGLCLKAEIMDFQYFEVEAFAKMQELRLLQLSYVNLNGSYKHFPKDLRWLSWHGFYSESFPTNLSLRSLVALDMQNSNLKQFWKAQAHPHPANWLKHLDLSHSVYLRETPDFSYFPNVKKLLLINCKSLVLIHKSIGILHKKLLLLNLSSCIELDTLPEELYKLKSLETLILSNCSKIERLDDAIGELESLITFAADFTSLSEIPSSINQLKNLKTLSVNGCKRLLTDGIDILNSEKGPSASPFLPLSLNGLNCLRVLSLQSCNLSDELIPKDIGSLSSLMHLDLRGNNFCNFQTDLASLTNLSRLNLSDCLKLQSIRNLPRPLYCFDLINCITLERTPDLSKCSGLYSLNIENCRSLVETPRIHNLKRLRFIEFGSCKLASIISAMLVQNWLKRNQRCIFHPAYNLQNWVRFRGRMRSFSFTVPATHNSDLAVGFTLWTTMSNELSNNFMSLQAITVTNLTRGGAWIHSLTQSNTFIDRNLMTNDFRLETGDQMKVYVDCDDRTTVYETGFALTYNARYSLDFSVGDNQFSEEDTLNGTADLTTFHCFRSNVGQGPLHAVIDHKVGGVEQLYTCSFFPETTRYEPGTRYQEDIQPVVAKSLNRPRRNLRMTLQKTLGAIGFLTFVVVLERYGKPLSRIIEALKLRRMWKMAETISRNLCDLGFISPEKVERWLKIARVVIGWLEFFQKRTLRPNSSTTRAPQLDFISHPTPETER